MEKVVTFAADMNIIEEETTRGRTDSIVFDHHESASHHTNLFIEKIIHSCD